MNINGQNVRDCQKEEVAMMLQGRAGSTVHVDVLRGAAADPIRIILTRNYNARSGSARKNPSLESNKPRMPPSAPGSSGFNGIRYPTSPAAPQRPLEEPSASEKSFGMLLPQTTLALAHRLNSDAAASRAVAITTPRDPPAPARPRPPPPAARRRPPPRRRLRAVSRRPGACRRRTIVRVGPLLRPGRLPGLARPGALLRLRGLLRPGILPALGRPGRRRRRRRAARGGE